LKTIRSMRRRPCIWPLLRMRTPVRFGVKDGAIEVTSEAAGRIFAIGIVGVTGTAG
jgi:hypothetical protein